MVVVIEGMDAAGKLTQSKMLAEKIGAARFAFPNYESPTGKLILSHLKKEWVASGDDPIRDAQVFQCLQTVNRLELLPDINACIARGQHIVFDRFWQSACVYGSLDGLDTKWLRLVQEKPMPVADVNILIDVPVDAGFERRPERRDRYETNRVFLEQVRDKYLTLFSEQQIHGAGRWEVINGLGSIEQVHERIMKVVGL
jgi:thymidylate kinase